MLCSAVAVLASRTHVDRTRCSVQELVGKLGSQKFEVLIGVLETAHSIFYRYRVDMKSEKLWQEIAKVLKAFMDPLTKLFKVCALFCVRVWLRAAASALRALLQQTLGLIKDNMVRNALAAALQLTCSC